MPETPVFDPFRAWLGVPAQVGGLDHYRLLGLRRFESDRDTIQRQVHDRIHRVSRHLDGPAAADCERVLQRIDAARVCLTTPHLKANYDRKLKAELAREAAPRSSAAEAAGRALGQARHAPSSETTRIGSSDSTPDLERPIDLDTVTLDDIDADLPNTAEPDRQPVIPAAPATQVKPDRAPAKLPVAKNAAEKPEADRKRAPTKRLAQAKPLSAAPAKPADDLGNLDLADLDLGAPKSRGGGSIDDLNLADVDLRDFDLRAEPAPAKPTAPATPAAAPATAGPKRSSVASVTDLVLNADDADVGEYDISDAPKPTAPQAKPAPAAAATPAPAAVTAKKTPEPAQPVAAAPAVKAGFEALPPSDPAYAIPLDPGYELVAPATPKAAPDTTRQVLRWMKSAVLVAMLGNVLLGTYLVWDRFIAVPAATPVMAASIVRPTPAPRPAPSGVKPPVEPAAPDKSAAAAASVAPLIAGPKPPVELGIAYGTEKRRWLEWAAAEFAATPEARGVRVNLIPMGSLEGAHAILSGNKQIHVWSPASSLYRQSFVRDWEARFGTSPIAKEEVLGLTPMVLVFWKSRFDAYRAKSPEISLRTMSHAVNTDQFWDRVAAKPDWGRFKLAFTHPNQSNSGLMALLVMAYEFHKKNKGLSVADVVGDEFQEYLARFQGSVSAESNSTGNLMREMVLRGPATYDALLVYESVVIDYLDRAEGRWEPLRVAYPRYNLWSDNPYCILNTPWTTPAHQKAAEAFLRFLISPAAQQRMLDHGFRPGNPTVSLKDAASPFSRYAGCGLSIDLGGMCETPSPEALENLRQSWIRHTPGAAN